MIFLPRFHVPSLSNSKPHHCLFIYYTYVVAWTFSK